MVAYGAQQSPGRAMNGPGSVSMGILNTILLENRGLAALATHPEHRGGLPPKRPPSEHINTPDPVFSLYGHNATFPS